MLLRGFWLEARMKGDSSSVIARNSPRIALTCRDNGTTCGKPRFMRSPGMTQVSASRISVHCAPISSEVRVNVCAKSSKPSRVTGSGCYVL